MTRASVDRCVGPKSRIGFDVGFADLHNSTRASSEGAHRPDDVARDCCSSNGPTSRPCRSHAANNHAPIPNSATFAKMLAQEQRSALTMLLAHAKAGPRDAGEGNSVGRILTLRSESTQARPTHCRSTPNLTRSFLFFAARARLVPAPLFPLADCLPTGSTDVAVPHRQT